MRVLDVRGRLVTLNRLLEKYVAGYLGIILRKDLEKE